MTIEMRQEAPHALRRPFFAVDAVFYPKQTDFFNHPDSPIDH